MTVCRQLIMGLVFVLGVSSANAGLITQNLIGTTTGGGLPTLDFDPFDSALGTLDRVFFNFTASHSISSDAFTCPTGCTVDGGFGLIFDTEDPNALIYEYFYTDSLFTIDPAEPPRTLANRMNYLRFYDAALDDLSPFLTAPVRLRLLGGFFIGPGRSGERLEEIDAELTYEFSSVPTPSTLALLLFGLVLVRNPSRLK